MTNGALFLPEFHPLGNEPGGDFSRRRIFSKANTFRGFFTQVLDADGGCQEVVRKVQAFAAARSMPLRSASTSAYCQARGKLEPSGLQRIIKHTAEHLQQRRRNRWWRNWRVVVVAGSLQRRRTDSFAPAMGRVQTGRHHDGQLGFLQLLRRLEIPGTGCGHRHDLGAMDAGRGSRNCSSAGTGRFADDVAQACLEQESELLS